MSLVWGHDKRLTENYQDLGTTVCTTYNIWHSQNSLSPFGRPALPGPLRDLEARRSSTLYIALRLPVKPQPTVTFDLRPVDQPGALGKGPLCGTRARPGPMPGPPRMTGWMLLNNSRTPRRVPLAAWLPQRRAPTLFL